MNLLPNKKDSLRDLALKSVVILLSLLIIVVTYYYLFPIINKFIGVLMPAILPFLFALILVILFDPLVEWINNKTKLNKGLGSIITTFVGLVFVGIMLWVMGANLVKELSTIIKTIPNISFDMEILNRLLDKFFINSTTPQGVIEQIQTTAMDIITKLTEFAGNIVSWSINFVGKLPGIFMALIFFFVAVFFFGRDKTELKNYFIGLLPNNLGNKTLIVFDELNTALFGFLRAQFLLMFITMVITIVGLFIAGSRYPITIGLLVGVFDILPILGPGGILVPWAIYTFIVGELYLGIVLLVIFAVVSVVRQVMQPKILGKNVGVHPLAILAAIVFGLAIFGVYGVLIGPIILVTIRAFYRAFKKSSNI